MPKHVWAIRVRLEIANCVRDLALFNLATDSKLRGCDLVELKVSDVFAAGQVKALRANKRETIDRLKFTLEGAGERIDGHALTDTAFVGCRIRRHIARLVRDWVTSIGLEPSSYGTHSMRRTKVAQIYRKTGNLRAVQLLLGHTKMDSTVRYLGVELEDTLAISEAVEI
mgnify:CR=1 FL=1